MHVHFTLKFGTETMKAPLLLEELLKKVSEELSNAVIELYNTTYREAYANGKSDQKEECECHEED